MPSRTEELPTRTRDSLPTAGTSQCLPVSNPGETIWQTTKHRLHDHRSTEKLPEYSDIVIIGAGYAGVSTAYHLVKDHGEANKSIAIIEARGACSGATGRNGGHARPDFYGHIPTYIDRAGDRAGAEIAEFEIKNLIAVKKVIEQEKIDCDFTLTRSIDVWCNAEAAEKARIRANSKLAKTLGTYRGPHTKTKELVRMLKEFEAESHGLPHDAPIKRYARHRSGL